MFHVSSYLVCYLKEFPFKGLAHQIIIYLFVETCYPSGNITPLVLFYCTSTVGNVVTCIVNVLDHGSQPFFPPGRTMIQVQVSRAARMSFTYYVIDTNNQIYNIIYSLNIMISERLHLLK